MELVTSVKVNRRAALVMATFAGVGFGLYNTYYPTVDVTISVPMMIALVLSLPATAIVHELVHGVTSQVLGYKPKYGFKPPMIYITFEERVSALHYKLIALAPFFIVTGACIAFIHYGIQRRFFYFCLMINVMGAVADLWAVIRLLFYNGGYEVQDTKSGFDLYKKD
jgi:hypothetical protein